LYQAYIGAEPPFIPVAVKVTPVPEQTVVAELAIEIPAVDVGITFTYKKEPVDVPQALKG
jgi:hypothetical protein